MSSIFWAMFQGWWALSFSDGCNAIKVVSGNRAWAAYSSISCSWCTLTVDEVIDIIIKDIDNRAWISFCAHDSDWWKYNDKETSKIIVASPNNETAMYWAKREKWFKCR